MKQGSFRKEVVRKGVCHPLSIFSGHVIYGVSTFFPTEREHAEMFDFSVLHSVGRRSDLRMLLEEVVEMSGILKAQAVANFCDVPVSVFE